MASRIAGGTSFQCAAHMNPSHGVPQPCALHLPGPAVLSDMHSPYRCVDRLGNQQGLGQVPRLRLCWPRGQLAGEDLGAVGINDSEVGPDPCLVHLKMTDTGNAPGVFSSMFLWVSVLRLVKRHCGFGSMVIAQK